MIDTKKYTELNDLKFLLGYKDVRPTENWCKTNQVTIIKLGKKKYIHNDILNSVFLNLFHKSILQSGQNIEKADKIISAIEEDDKITLANLLNSPIHEDQIVNFAKKKEKSYNDIINEYKRA